MITPTGAALFTRKENQGFDYGWYVQIGITQLQEMAKVIYSETLCRDVIGNSDSVSFSVIQHGQQIGLLIADMLTSRRDFSGRPILTTLYVEFKASDRRAILSAATTLLKEELDLFLAYAEDLFSHSPSQPDPIQLPQITLSSVPMGSVNSLVRRGLVYSPFTERCQYADFLAKLPAEFCFVSTGHVGLSRYETLATYLGNRIKLLVLTLTETEIIELSDQVIRPPYKHWLQLNWVKQGLTVVLIAMLVVGGGSGYWWYTEEQKRGLEEQNQKDQAAKKIAGLEKQLQAKNAQIETANKAAQTAEKQVSQLTKEKEELETKLKTEKDSSIATSQQLNTNETDVPTKIGSGQPITQPPVTNPPPQQSEQQKDFEKWLSVKSVDKDGKLTDKTIGDALRESRESFKQWLDKKSKQKQLKDWFKSRPQPAYFFLEHYCIEFTPKYQQMQASPGVENYCEEYVEYEKKNSTKSQQITTIIIDCWHNTNQYSSCSNRDSESNDNQTVVCNHYHQYSQWILFGNQPKECSNDN